MVLDAYCGDNKVIHEFKCALTYGMRMLGDVFKVVFMYYVVLGWFGVIQWTLDERRSLGRPLRGTSTRFTGSCKSKMADGVETN